jgi:hypothetical protein
MGVGTVADRDAVPRDGPGAITGETTTVGEEIAGAITDLSRTVGGTVASATTVSERSTGGIGGLTIDGETLVSTATGAIVLVVEFNMGIVGDKVVPFTGRESSKPSEGVKQLMVS